MWNFSTKNILIILKYKIFKKFCLLTFIYNLKTLQIKLKFQIFSKNKMYQEFPFFLFRKFRKNSTKLLKKITENM